MQFEYPKVKRVARQFGVYILSYSVFDEKWLILKIAGVTAFISWMKNDEV